MSRISGTLLMRIGLSVSSTALSICNASFLAPWGVMAPLRRCPPSIMNVPILYVVYFRMEYNIVFFLAFPIVLGLISISQSFVPLFFGEGYDKVIILLNVISPTIILTGMANVIGTQYLLPIKRQKEYTFTITIGLVINFILNFISKCFSSFFRSEAVFDLHSYGGFAIRHNKTRTLYLCASVLTKD